MEYGTLNKVVITLWGKYLRSHRRWDFALAFLGSGALAGAWELNLMSGADAIKSTTLFATLAGASVTLLGFAITSLAILIGLFQAPEFSPLRKNNDYGSIFKDYKLAIILLAITTVVTLGVTMMVAARLYSTIALGLALGMMGWSALTMAHAVEILWLAIKTHSNAEQDY